MFVFTDTRFIWNKNYVTIPSKLGFQRLVSHILTSCRRNRRRIYVLTKKAYIFWKKWVTNKLKLKACTFFIVNQLDSRNSIRVSDGTGFNQPRRVMSLWVSGGVHFSVIFFTLLDPELSLVHDSYPRIPRLDSAFNSYLQILVSRSRGVR